MYVESDRFLHAYRMLYRMAQERYPEEEVSFTSGMWNEEEGYKRKYWEDARAAMEVETWPEHQNDYEYIFQKAIRPFWIETEDSTIKVQNLVSKENYTIIIEKMSASERKGVANAIYAVFYGNNDRDAFEQLTSVLKKKSLPDPLSVVSLYFFLKDKDKDQYVTVRKIGTGKRLGVLGLNVACLQNCTWDGYNQFLEIVKEIREKLLPYHPDATLLDAQSFLWMLDKIPKFEKSHPAYRYDKPIPRVLLCNTAWMEFYDQLCFTDDNPRHGGSFVTNTGSAFECFNFHRYEDGYYGFVETGYTGGTAIQENAKQLHIENLDSKATGDSIDNVTVVFCAHSDELKKTVIVGWYENATVLRFRETYHDGHIYNIQSSNAFLLPTILRTKVIPRAKDGNFGFGQSNVRYPIGKDADIVVKDIIDYIKGFKTKESIKAAEEKKIASLTDDQLKNRIGEQSSAPAPVYTAVATMRKRNPYLAEMAKRRARGVCQLCGNSLDFHDSAGRPYLEAHHIVPLAKDGADAITNMTALCPNCHRKMHIVGDQADIEKLLNSASLNL